LFDIDGTKLAVDLRNSAEKEEFLVDPPVMARYVQMTITGVY